MIYPLERQFTNTETDLLELMFVFAEADGRMKREYTGFNSRGRNVHLKTIKKLYDEILERGDCVDLRDWQSTEAT